MLIMIYLFFMKSPSVRAKGSLSSASVRRGAVGRRGPVRLPSLCCVVAQTSNNGTRDCGSRLGRSSVGVLSLFILPPPPGFTVEALSA